MENLQYSKTLRKNWEVIALMIGIAMVLSLVVSLVQPFQYSASTNILIIQKQEGNLDAYTATKSAERIGKNLANIINTTSFYNEVIESNADISAKFPADGRERRKEWKENVKVEVIPETGILEITVFDEDKKFASNLARTISYVLVNKGAEYHGGGADVQIKIVDDILLSKYPVRPNIIVNCALAVIIGLLLGSAFVILNEARKMEKAKNRVFDSSNRKAREQASDEAELAPVPVLSQRETVIKTMYDHLQ